MSDYSSPREHRDAIIKRVGQRIAGRYDPGQEEHGGRLWCKPTLRQLEAELIDAIVYYDVEEEHKADALAVLDAAAQDEKFSYDSYYEDLFDKINRARNILRYGNPEGEIEEDR